MFLNDTKCLVPGNNIISVDLMYGEVDFSSLALMFVRYIPMQGRKVFVDLGSGTGRAVFAAALVHNFSKLRGL
jgi:hypothetical protein